MASKCGQHVSHHLQWRGLLPYLQQVAGSPEHLGGKTNAVHRLEPDARVDSSAVRSPVVVLDDSHTRSSKTQRRWWPVDGPRRNIAAVGLFVNFISVFNSCDINSGSGQCHIVNASVSARAGSDTLTVESDMDSLDNTRRVLTQHHASSSLLYSSCLQDAACRPPGAKMLGQSRCGPRDGSLSVGNRRWPLAN